jgi:hypothetical protein
MNKADIGNMVLLSKKLLPIVNVVGYRGNKRNKAMTIKQMGTVIGLQERQAYRFIKKMIGLRMIAKYDAPISGGHEVQYVINPVYFLNGKTISDDLYWLFNDHLKEELPKWVQDEYMKRRDEL